MQPGLMIGEIFLLLTSVASWLFSISLHRTVQSEGSNAIKLHPLLAKIFGSSTASGILDIRGLLMQVLVLTITPAIGLYIAGFISNLQFAQWYRSIILIVVLFVFFELFRGK